MRKTLLTLAVFLAAGLAFAPESAPGQLPGQPAKGLPFELGPGDKGATLKQPWLETTSPPAPASGTAPSYIQGLLNETGAGRTMNTSGQLPPSSLLPYDTAGMNNDILVTQELGQWMVMLISYAGPEGPARARKMVFELRSRYKLPAYVFNFGAEEKRQELERVKAIIEKQREGLKAKGLPVDQPIRVRHMRIDEHCGVLIGGYPTEEAAIKARDTIRRLPLPDPRIFKLNQDGDLLNLRFVMPEDENQGALKPVADYVNPFSRAIHVHNPTIKVQRPPEFGKLNTDELRRMNSEEEFNLLKCKKPFTLVIKQFSVPSRTDVGSAGFWDTLGFGKRSADHIDYAARNAHDLAEALRKSKLDAYVLHTKYYSLVTVGGFDSLEDPNLRSMKTLIETRLVPQMEGIQLFEKALPWQIPH